MVSASRNRRGRDELPRISTHGDGVDEAEQRLGYPDEEGRR